MNNLFLVLPELCPIMLDIMVCPLIDPNGNASECRAIFIGWIRTQRTSPLMQNMLTPEQLHDNNVLEELIHAEVNEADDLAHPSIWQWKESQNYKECKDAENVLHGLRSWGVMDVPEDEEYGHLISGEGIKYHF